MSSSLHPTVCAIALAILAMTATSPSNAGERPINFGSLTFADERSRQMVEAYIAFLERDVDCFAKHLATIRSLARSDVEYRVTVTSQLGDGIEGMLSTDGVRVFIRVDGRAGPGGARWSLHSRLAHEFEHARQFENGEFAFLRDHRTGAWGSEYATYDLGDEVRAWEAQLAVSTADDLWTSPCGHRKPSFLQRFADARSTLERARVLVSMGYTGRNPELDSNVVAASPRHPTGTLLGPPQLPNFFGRIHTSAHDAAVARARNSPKASS